MKKAIILSVSALLICAGLQAQKVTEGHWGKKYLDVAYSAAATDDGGYIITGLTKMGMGDAYGDIVVIKTDALGDTMWTFTYGGPLLEGGNNVIQTADGGYMVSGHTEDFGADDCDAFLMKLDKTGKHEWFRVYGGEDDDISNGVTQLADGGYVLAGETASYGNPPSDSETRHVYLIRTNSTGDTLWTRCYAGHGAEYMYTIVPMAAGGFLSVGFTSSRGHGELDAWLMKLKDNGDTTTTWLHQAAGDSRFYKIIPTTDNGFMVAGYTTLAAGGHPLGMLTKLDADGNQLWCKTYGDSSKGLLLNDIAQLPNGNYMVAGINYAADPTGEAYVLTTDGSGNVITDGVYGGAGSIATSIALQGNNGYLIAGMSTQYGDSYGDLYYREVNNTISNVPGVNVPLPRIFPNPVTDRSSVILPESEAFQTVALEVTDLKGNVVYKQENIPAKDLVLDRKLLASGTYFFRAMCKDGREFTGKFVAE